jgi:hypothetical protein
MATQEQLTAPAWLVGTVRGLFDQYHKIAVAHSTNNGLLITQNQAAMKIGNPTVRARVLATIQADVARQGLIAAALRALYATLQKARDTLAGAFRLVGVDASEISTLSDVGFVPVIPIAVGLGLVAASATAVILWNATQAQRQAIANNTSVINAVLGGRLDVADGLALIKQNSDSADQSKDVLGLKKIITSATPVVALIVAAIVIPPLLGALHDFLPRPRAA